MASWAVHEGQGNGQAWTFQKSPSSLRGHRLIPCLHRHPTRYPMLGGFAPPWTVGLQTGLGFRRIGATRRQSCYSGRTCARARRHLGEMHRRDDLLIHTESVWARPDTPALRTARSSTVGPMRAGRRHATIRIPWGKDRTWQKPSKTDKDRANQTPSARMRRGTVIIAQKTAGTALKPLRNGQTLCLPGPSSGRLASSSRLHLARQRHRGVRGRASGPLGCPCGRARR